MEIVAFIAAVAGLVLLLVGVHRQRGHAVDALTALDRLDRHGPVLMPAMFWGAAFLGVIGAVLGWSSAIGVLPAVVGGLSSLAFTWLVWVWIWDSYRVVVDLAVVSQVRVPLDQRPAIAFAPPRSQALSFRPVRNALSFVAALAGGGVVFWLLYAWAGTPADRLGAAAVGYISAVSAYFAFRVKRALDAERDVRRIAARLGEADDETVLRALQENPRSRVLLEAHADRLMAAGQPSQALLEYRAAGGAKPGARLADRARGAVEAGGDLRERVRGELVLEPYASRPTATIAPLEMSESAEELLVLDAEQAVGVLVDPDAPWAAGSRLLVAIDPELGGDVAARLEPALVRAPLVMSSGPFPRFLAAYRLTHDVAKLAVSLVRDAGARAPFRQLKLFSAEELLALYDAESRTVRLAPLAADELYAELRRTAAVAAR